VQREVQAGDPAARSQLGLEIVGPLEARDHGANDEARAPQTARRLRPLARRALITARPPRLFMRTRKPWVRARRTLEAW
jgi:hypothetical protein